MFELLTAQSLFDTHKDLLDLDWVAGGAGAGRGVDSSELQQSEQPLVGRLNCIQPSRIQVLGKDELTYLDSLGKNSRTDLVEKLFLLAPLAVIVADRQSVPEDLSSRAEYSGTPLFSSQATSRKLINSLLEYYASAFAEKSTLHGVFMEVQGIGVLLTGKSGIGKSELALELLSRGHRLVADDAPEFIRVAPDTVSGRCPPVLQDFIEVRGLGVMNVRSLFGDSAIKPDKNLRLIINLKEMEDLELLRMDRLEGNRTTRICLDVEIPEVTLPVAPGRNLAVLVESAASHHILRMKGYQPAQDFIKRQRQHLAEGNS